VLVGVVGSAIAMTGRSPETLEATAHSLGTLAPQPAHWAPSAAVAIARARERFGSVEAVKPSSPAHRAEEPAREPARDPALVLISSFNAPSCKQLLRGRVAERHDPKAAQRETRLGNRELVRGNVAGAQAAYCKALLWDRRNVDRHVNLGRLFLVRRDWRKAAEYGQSALELDARNRAALGVLGDAQAALHETDKARAAWLGVEGKSNPSAHELDLVARRNMALAWRVERLKDYSLAERIYRRVLLFSPEHAGAARGIASCLVKIGDYPAAQAWARRADALSQSEKGRTTPL
jgi:tetratricopeptide (TPR) repeat protein